jgi:TatD DNase family protein
MTAVFVDTHTHLFLPEFGHDRNETVQRAIDHGVKAMFLPNVDLDTIHQLFDLANAFPAHCFPIVGLHPESVHEDFEEKLIEIEKIITIKKVYGIGETGLDYYWDLTYKEQQKASFNRQLKMAIKYQLPVVIHVRNSFDDVIDILQQNASIGLTGIFHCFTGTLKEAEKIISLGFYLGIGGVVTFKNGGLDKVIPEVPLESIVLETDSPFLSPVPYRGKRNESSYVIQVAERIAQLKNLPLEEVAQITTQNAVKLFKFEIKFD